MTFYNHIESLRGIAIDLTNGRKWRGASDKAAVFDALDAARREYMSLSDENAKLRELIADEGDEPHECYFKWSLADNGWADHTCSECGFVENTDIHVGLDWNYCPNCGRKVVFK